MIIAHVLPRWLWVFQHWFVNAGPNGGYGFWSGVAGATAIFSGVVVFYRHKNCHEPMCWRLGKHPVEGTPYTTCHRHHPGLEGARVKRGHIHAAHRARLKP